MDYPLTGYHHITACAGGAQQDIEFFTQAVGLRMAKQTVLMDGKIPIYHLYYSNAKIEPGSVMTTFPYSRLQGRRGSGQVRATAFTVAKGTLPFWKDHLKRHKLEQQPIAERFGQSFIRFSHPSGLEFEVIEDPMTTGKVGPRQRLVRAKRYAGFTARYCLSARCRKPNVSSSMHWASGRPVWTATIIASKPEPEAPTKP